MMDKANVIILLLQHLEIKYKPLQNKKNKTKRTYMPVEEHIDYVT